jgi:transketolase
MRNKFGEVLYKLGSKDKEIYVVVADISPASGMDKFRERFPDRFINVGVAEQTMIGLAAGLAMAGKKPFAYTIATFAAYRPFEMIRNDLCYQNLPVTVIGMGSGTVYSSLGGTHLSQEDISVIRSIPNINVFSPIDADEFEEILKYCAFKSNKPNYIRIGKSGEKNLTQNSLEKWKFGKIRKILNGKNTCVLVHGKIAEIAFDVQKQCKKNFSIYSCNTLKPFDELRLKKIFVKYKKIIVLEDHSIIGGLSSIVSSLAFKLKYRGKIKNFSLKDNFFHFYGSQNDLLKLHGIDSKKILKEIT